MKERRIISIDDEVNYIHSVADKLARMWNDPKVNNRGMRAAFRRWRPEAHGEPTMEMRSLIWAHGGVPVKITDDIARRAPSDEEREVVDHAAVIVTLRAISGDHQGTDRNLGVALYDAGLSDGRLSRLLATPLSSRLESLIRVMQRINHEGVTIAWTSNEVRRLLNYLYGNEEQARWSVNSWASAFFRTEALSVKDKKTNDPNPESTPSTTQSVIQD